MKITSENKDDVLVLMNGRVLETCLFITYTSSTTPPIPNVPFKVVENRYKLDDNFKIELVPLIEGIAKEEFYLLDFNQFVRNGHATVYIKNQLT